MADPIIPNAWRVQLVLQGATDLPEDRFVNALAFNQPGVQSAHSEFADDVQGVFNAFFNNTHTGATGPIVSHIAGWVTGGEIRVYDLRQAPPREPEIRPLTVNFNATTGLPAEVALCSSLVAIRNLPRQRGRFYFGPLANNAGVITTGSATDDARPSATVIANLVAATEFLAGPHSLLVGAGDDYLLAIISQVDQTIRCVTGGWVDNAFDTQRRRGAQANDRTLWGEFTS